MPQALPAVKLALQLPAVIFEGIWGFQAVVCKALQHRDVCRLFTL